MLCLLTISVVLLVLLSIGLYAQSKNEPIPPEGHTNPFKGDWLDAQCRAYGVDEPLDLLKVGERERFNAFVNPKLGRPFGSNPDPQGKRPEAPKAPPKPPGYE